MEKLKEKIEKFEEELVQNAIMNTEVKEHSSQSVLALAHLNQSFLESHSIFDLNLAIEKIKRGIDASEYQLENEPLLDSLDAEISYLETKEEKEAFREELLSPAMELANQEFIYLSGVKDALDNPELMAGLLKAIDKSYPVCLQWRAGELA